MKDYYQIILDNVGEFSAEEMDKAQDMYQASRLLNRVIIPAKVNNQSYGFVARDITGNTFIPKVLNSTGAFTSKIVWNYDNVKQSEVLIISEGIFDATSIGIDRAIALLGKNLSDSSDQIKLIKTLNPDRVVVFLDRGAEKDAVKMANLLSYKFLDSFHKCLCNQEVR